MMAESKYFKRTRIVLGSTLVMALAGCSTVSSVLNVDAVDDNIDYLRARESVKALAIPPGLSVPEFDNTYTASQTPVPASNAQIASSAAAITPNPVATTTAPARVQVAMMRLKGGEPALAVNAPYVQTWRGLGAVLNRVGLQVQKQQPLQGIYTTVYQGSRAEQGGVLQRMLNVFSSDAKPASSLQQGATYLILVAENKAGQSFIGVADQQGKPATEAVANEVLALLKEDYERP
ncbi:MAG: outer membrane protein assembly factor BamC [Thiolinea sp.]